MMPNALTRHVGLNAGTWVLETLLKHYFENLFKDKAARAAATEPTPTNVPGSGELKKDELLYDEAFNIIKSFLDAATYHTVEELQEFSNARTPSPPWMHVMRVLVPMSSCDDAATYLIEALGGEEKTREVVGGTKWWQVRGLKGVDAQWIVARKDYQQALKRRKRVEKAEKERKEHSNEDNEDVYSPEMDELRCILYFHGGGYYFGSVDQERYFMQRFARKTGCRLLAINYRLAPQYPFPCAIQDALATYLYLIRPPEGAPHTPVNPAHILISGDSAGGGLTLALLQVLRDTSLPMPAGAIPISPWCDLTHSFPSIHLNTDTDIIPKYGLSVYKPSPLWPPPSDEVTNLVHKGLRSRVKSAVKQYYETNASGKLDSAQKQERESARRFWQRKSSFGQNKTPTSPPTHTSSSLAEDARTGDVRGAALTRTQEEDRVDKGAMIDGVHVGSTAPILLADETKDESLVLVTESGETLKVHDQVHMYAPNTLLAHPLISPAVSYLGGLPPLLVIASDGEVLRDEIIYSAHKAAHPEKYPIKPEVKKLYPKLEGIEDRFGPTKVHLQVYDETAHVLPVLFSFCTPAKYCFRALATFGKNVLGTLDPPAVNDETGSSTPSLVKRSMSYKVTRRLSFMGNNKSQPKPSKRRTISQPSIPPVPGGSVAKDNEVESVSNSSIGGSSSGGNQAEVIRYAGEPEVYRTKGSPYKDNMIRERISVRGEIRPLEPESELPACNLPPERIGAMSELVLRRYIEGSTKWNERFARKKKEISKSRARSLTRAKKKDSVRNKTFLQMHFYPSSANSQGQSSAEGSDKPGLGLLLQRTKSPESKDILNQPTASWAWAWALDGLEKPPPSSIVARRDTEEARRLGKIADQPGDGQDHKMSANNLWSFLINKLNLEKEKAILESSAAAEYNPQDDNDNSLDEEDIVANQPNSGLDTIDDIAHNDGHTSEEEKRTRDINNKQTLDDAQPSIKTTEDNREPPFNLGTIQTPESVMPSPPLPTTTLPTATTTSTKANGSSNSEVEPQKKKYFRSLSASRPKQSTLLPANGAKDSTTAAPAPTTNTTSSNDDIILSIDRNDESMSLSRRGIKRLVSASAAIVSRARSPSRPQHTPHSNSKSETQLSKPQGGVEGRDHLPQAAVEDTELEIKRPVESD